MKGMLIVISLVASFSTFAQAKVYWVEGYRYVYSAIYMNESGDTLSNETVLVLPTDSIFNGNQTVLYYYFSRENQHLKARTDSILGFDNAWVDSTGEGALENGRLWIHPFRSNQYVLTEMAPFPMVHLPVSEGTTWKSLLKLPKVWGRFSGKVKNTYTVIGKESREYGWGSEECWRVESKGKHRRIGTSSLTIFYNEEFGFLEMKYQLFNGDTVLFELVEKDVHSGIVPELK